MPRPTSSTLPPGATRRVIGTRATFMMRPNSRVGDRTTGNVTGVTAKKPGGSRSMRTATTSSPAGLRSNAWFHSGIILWQTGQLLRKNMSTVVVL
jgi:hypothetical protein